MSDIKSMKLYTHVERIENELAELGIDPESALQVDQLSRFDQLHYHGTDALDLAMSVTSCVAGQSWLEVGSGIGGPARYLADRGRIQLTALELQPDQNDLAEQLTRRCSIDHQVTHLCGDFLDYDFNTQKFDAVVSWLALYHIPDRSKLLRQCFDLLNPGGYFYTEDLCRIGEIDETQMKDLERDLYAITLPESTEYAQQLESAGFDIVLEQDMTDDWSKFTHDRLAAYRAERDRHLRVHGQATVDALEAFYSAVDHQFQSGKLGGLRICAKRRS